MSSKKDGLDYKYDTMVIASNRPAIQQYCYFLVDTSRAHLSQTNPYLGNHQLTLLFPLLCLASLFWCQHCSCALMQEPWGRSQVLASHTGSSKVQLSTVTSDAQSGLVRQATVKRSRCGRLLSRTTRPFLDQSGVRVGLCEESAGHSL